MSRRALSRLTGLALASAVLAACGGGPAASNGGTTALPSGIIGVEAKDFSFTPSALTAVAGPVTFSVRNVGTQEHEFEIFQGDSVVDEIEGLVPGLTKDITVDLAAGEYTYVCKLNGHDQLGMKGTLTVTGS